MRKVSALFVTLCFGLALFPPAPKPSRTNPNAPAPPLRLHLTLALESPLRWIIPAHVPRAARFTVNSFHLEKSGAQVRTKPPHL